MEYTKLLFQTSLSFPMATSTLFLLLWLLLFFFFFFIVFNLLRFWWILPRKSYGKLTRSGFIGPTPCFPLGNLPDMKRTDKKHSSSSSNITHDIHSTVFPYFARWQQSHGKVFIYWLGTEPFLYIADPEFLKMISAGVMGKSWGKPTVFKNDREPMFGSGLIMVEGDDWVRHRQVITPAFSPTNLKAMESLMVESTTKMMNRWTELIGSSGRGEIDVEREITATAGEIIAKTSFGISYDNGRKVLEKLTDMQITLFKSNRFVGVPFGQFLSPKQTLVAKRLGKEIDGLLLSIISDRQAISRSHKPEAENQHDLLGLLLAENQEGRLGKKLTTRELVDECKTFFFGGHETTALALTWTLLLLAIHPEWQNQLREEIKQHVGIGVLGASKLNGLKKMGWVMNEVLRLYSPAPNVQRQAREDIRVNADVVIPKGTNMWIDVVGMHHDRSLWGDDVNEFRPDRFKEDQVVGGCKHKMGFLPFGFGGRMCVGRNLSTMEYKVVLSLLLTHFSFSLSPSYSHSPAILLSLRPTRGMPLFIQPL